VNRITRVIILGGGSAGYLAALALKRKLPHLAVTVIRSREIGVIGVGEGSTVALPDFLHQYLRVDARQFFAMTRPTFKMGLRFLWGPRPYFNYSFTNQFHETVSGLPRSTAFYCWNDMDYGDPGSAMMSLDRVFPRGPNGDPVLHNAFGYHIENVKFVGYLEHYATSLGVVTLDDVMLRVEQDESGIQALHLQSGLRETADLFVDASGFRSELLGRALAEPFVSYGRSLYCDRAIVGSWARSGPGDAVIKPYTTCETMDAGWCWQIDHETHVNRGYVHSSAFISEADAEAELRRKNPKIGPTSVVKFISGRYRNLWVKNVVAIGNAGGFVEPLEATGLAAIVLQSRYLAEVLLDDDGLVTATSRDFYNRILTRNWDGIRDFLSIHYRFNTRLDTPFWQHCRAECDLAGAGEFLAVYREHGPCLWLAQTLDRANQFGVHGYLALLLGQQVQHGRPYHPSPAEVRAWSDARQKYREWAMRGLDMRETLARIHSPNWRWQ
jgi:tryptophan halogenase